MSKVEFDFNEENFIVTGASSGMGRQVVLDLARSGARVLAIARRKEALDDLKKSYPENIFIEAIDVCCYDKLEYAIEQFVVKNGKFSGGVYAAGISGFTPLKMYDEIYARKIMDVSFWSGIKFLQICTKSKMSNKMASFVMFSSICAQRTDKGIFAYAGAKAALNVAIKTLAKETFNRGIRINTISPGWVKTAMTDNLEEVANLEDINGHSLLGIGTPIDITGTVLFLLSSEARWITGSDFIVDGGYSL